MTAHRVFSDISPYHGSQDHLHKADVFQQHKLGHGHMIKRYMFTIDFDISSRTFKNYRNTDFVEKKPGK